MTSIDWALYTESAVGRGAPAMADIINRPLREVITLSGGNPDASFPGFVLQGGTFTGTFTGTVIGPTYGGTGQNAVALGDFLYGSAANTWSRLSGNALTARRFLVSAGDGVIPTAPTWGLPTAAEIVAGTFTGSFTFASIVTVQNTITSTLGTVTLNTPAFLSTGTWNNVATTFLHQYVTIIDTASAVGSMLALWQVNGFNIFSVTKTGFVTANAFTAAVTTGTTVAASMYATAAAGLVLRAASGSAADFLLQTSSGANVAYVPPGTSDFGIVGKSGFNGTVPIAKPTVAGSRGANAALASLLVALSNYGLVVDASS